MILIYCKKSLQNNSFKVRSQEEIMNECQVWWTITGNFGNMMPIDWSKSTARAKQLPTLNLCNPRSSHNKKATFHSSEDLVDGLEDEDDLVAADLDMHSLILSSNPQEHAVSLLHCCFSGLYVLKNHAKLEHVHSFFWLSI